MKCRLCVFECPAEDSVSIFCEEEESNITKLIVKYLYLEITKYDEFSTKICVDCKRHLQEFHEFFEKVEIRQRQLKSGCIEQLNKLTTSATESKPTNFEYIEESSIDLKDVALNNKIATLPETEEFEFADDRSDSSSSPSNIVPIIEIEIQKTEKGKKNQNKSSSAKSNDNATLPVEKKKRGRPRKGNKMETEKKDTSESNNMLSPEKERERDDFIAKNIELKCEICGEVSLAFKKFKSHFRKKHNQRAYIICCGLRFTQRWRLINHVRLHVDPNHFKCKHCDKTLTTQLGYDTHIAKYHGDEEAKKHECQICQRRFNRKNALNVHLLSHKREANHPCELCDKSFKTSRGLKQHIEYLHGERKTFICHICGKELETKHNLETHITEAHTGIPKSECSFCGIWVSSNYLKKHEEYHVLKEVECDLCGKMFPSEGALRGHKRGNAHKERIFSCTFCEKAFKEKRFLREHIAMHTGQKDYACKYCQRGFRAQANMNKHIRQLHFAEYALEQAQKKFYKTVKNTNAVLGV